MTDQRDQQDLEQMVEAQERGEELPGAEVPTETEPSPERKLDQRKSKKNIISNF